MKMRLKKYLDRILVGSEQLLAYHSRCPGCGMAAGATHSFGCPHEECPGCRKILIGCHCNCLSPADSAKIIKALHDQFNNLADAVGVVTAAEVEPGPESSYLVHAAMQYLYENVDQSIRAELNHDFRARHPDLVPLLQDETGYGYYTAEQLAEALRIPLAEVHEKIDAMVAAGQGIRFGAGIRLQKVN